MQTIDIMIHINGSLDTVQQQVIESELREVEGMIAPRFDRPHLLVILYGKDTTSSSVLLNMLKDKGYQAQLVGL